MIDRLERRRAAVTVALIHENHQVIEMLKNGGKRVAEILIKSMEFEFGICPIKNLTDIKNENKSRIARFYLLRIKTKIVVAVINNRRGEIRTGR